MQKCGRLSKFPVQLVSLWAVNINMWLFVRREIENQAKAAKCEVAELEFAVVLISFSNYLDTLKPQNKIWKTRKYSSVETNSAITFCSISVGAAKSPI